MRRQAAPSLLLPREYLGVEGACEGLFSFLEGVDYVLRGLRPHPISPVQFPRRQPEQIRRGMDVLSFSTSWSMILRPCRQRRARDGDEVLERLFARAPQIRPPVQRATASPSTRSTSADAQDGGGSGKTTLQASRGRSESTAIGATCGITSPARRITTLSPRFSSLSVQFHIGIMRNGIAPCRIGNMDRLQTRTSVIAQCGRNSTSRTKVICSCAGQRPRPSAARGRRNPAVPAAPAVDTITTPSIIKPRWGRSSSTYDSK